MSWLRNRSLKIKSATLALVLLCGNVFGMALPFMPSQVASAAPLCVVDTAGANDLSGQKDLTKLCIDYTNAPTSVATLWNWDETGTNGANTMDACNLFDTNGDGNINYAVCVTTTNDPAVMQSFNTYSCGDSKIDRCTSTSALVSSGSTTCAVSQQNTDPFVNGDSSPKDTQASCTVSLATVGGASAKLIDVCSYPSQQPNSSPSDCVIARPSSGKIEVIKNLVPVNDPGLFNLQIDAVTKVSNVTNGGTTGENVVSAANHSVGELAGTSTALAGYTTTIVCKNLNGTGAIVAQGTSTSLAAVPVADGSDIVCTITNTRQSGSVRVVKDVINDNGGTKTSADYTFTNNSGAPQTFVTTTSPDGERVLTLPVGSNFAISEVQANTGGYATTYSGTCTGTVTVVQQTCTITNNDIAPTLTLVKTVTNNNGGTKTAADFQGKIDGNNVAWSTPLTLDAGVHTASETTLPAYDASVWGGNCATNGTITLLPGDNKTCTITNDDKAPSLTLNKIVSNLHGGTELPSAWTLTATGPTTLSGAGADGSADVVSQQTFASGIYTLSESAGPTGYAPSAWTCTNGIVVTNAQITLANDTATVCTITNSDIAPFLTIVKEVLNPYGTALPATSFPLLVDNTSVTTGVATSQFNAGTHTVTETQQTGYTFSSFTGTNCSIDKDGIMTVLLSLAGNTSCTITNTAIQPKLTVTKVVINDNGGRKVVSDFPLFVNQTSVVSGVQNGFNTGSYVVSETADPGYESSIAGNCSGSGEITLSLGDVKTCTITNDDIAPVLKLVKIVTNNNGGTKVVSDFPLAINGNTVISGQPNTLSANVLYTASETNLPGYAASVWSGGCAANGTITLLPGEHKTCTITNDDIQGTLTINKVVVNDNGGNAQASDFSFAKTGDIASYNFVNGTTTLVGSKSFTINAGTYSAVENSFTGYLMTNNTCVDVVVVNGGTASCTITNNDISPTLTVIKHVVNNNGGLATAAAFDMQITSANSGYTHFAGSEAGTTVPINAGAYSVAESAPFGGYGASLSNDCGGTIAIGEHKTCTVTNDDIAPSLTLNKILADSFGGSYTEASWLLTADGAVMDLSGAGAAGSTDVVSGSGFYAGNYTLSETGPTTGFTSSAWDCGNTVVTSNVISILLGQVVTCTITNTSVQPKITLVKVIDGNQYGDTSTVNDFGLTLGGTAATSGTAYGKNVGSYAINEAGKAGYNFVSITGDAKCPATLNGTVNLALGDDITCTIHNQAVAPVLTLKKIAINNNGGTSLSGLFNLKAGDSSFTGGTSTVDPNDSTKTTTTYVTGLGVGTYALSEDSLTGYESSSWSCNKGLNESSVTVALGDDITCTVTNDDVAPTLTVIKHVVNNNGGTATVADFGITNNNAGLSFGAGVTVGTTTTYTSTPTVSSNTNYVLSELDFAGYAEGTWACSNETTGTGLDVTVNLNEGENVTCEITNDDIAPHIVVEKYVVNDNSGKAAGNDFHIKVDGVEQNMVLDDKDGTTSSYVAEADVVANKNIVINEIDHPDYSEGKWYCDLPNELGQAGTGLDVSINLLPGQTAHCAITNNDIPHPQIHVVKSGPASAQAGTKVTYTFTVTNTGDVALNDLTVVDSLTGNGTYVSGDANSDHVLDLKETWVYTGVYTIPATQKADVVNTVEACGYDSKLVVNDEEYNNERVQLLPVQVRVSACGNDKHSLSIPQVLGESTSKLVNTGAPMNPLYTLFALFNVAAGLGLVMFNKKQKLNAK